MNIGQFDEGAWIKFEQVVNEPKWKRGTVANERMLVQNDGRLIALMAVVSVDAHHRFSVNDGIAPAYKAPQVHSQIASLGDLVSRDKFFGSLLPLGPKT